MKRTTMSAAIASIILGLFGLYTLEFGVVGILPAIVTRFGITVSQAGFLMGLFALVVATCGPFLVLFSSRFDRKLIAIVALLGFSLCSILSAYAPNFLALMALRVIPALLHPVFFSAAFAAAASLYPKDRSAHAMAQAFVGVTFGMVLGVPATTWVAAHVSYQASFYFCATATLMAAVGLLLMLPKQVRSEPLSFGRQLSILRKVALWINIAATISVFAAMFAVYSYAAEYLQTATKMTATNVSIILVIFGLGGVAGNLLAGKLLHRSLVLTTLLHPVALAGAYLILFEFGNAELLKMAAIALLWGASHTSGMLITQVWLTSVAPEAPEFATSLFVSAANGGVVLGSAGGGLFIDTFGIAGVIWCGMIFSAVGFALVGLKALLYRGQSIGLENTGPVH